jgi:hypothetical protein
VAKKGFPDTQFKFMQQINHEHAGDIKIKAKFINECILKAGLLINNHKREVFTCQGWNGRRCFEKPIYNSTSDGSC